MHRWGVGFVSIVFVFSIMTSRLDHSFTLSAFEPHQGDAMANHQEAFEDDADLMLFNEILAEERRKYQQEQLSARKGSGRDSYSSPPKDNKPKHSHDDFEESEEEEDAAMRQRLIEQRYGVRFILLLSGLCIHSSLMNVLESLHSSDDQDQGAAAA
jgi:hypothetical protein